MKAIIYVLTLVLMVIFVTSVTLSSKEEVINTVRSLKIGIGNSISEATNTLTYTSDKECIIDFDSEEFVCNICFSYNYNSVTFDDCIPVPEETTENEDRDLIIGYVSDHVYSHESQREYKYIKRSLKGKKLIVIKI